MSHGDVFRGKIHRITRARSSALGDTPLVAFEYGAADAADSDSTIICLGGLGNGLLSVRYVARLAQSLPPHWRLIEPILNSSYRQWGVSSLSEDVTEITDLVHYFQNNQGKVVLLGHSTGCQMIFHYLLSPLATGERERPSLAGAILQGGISDREALLLLISRAAYDEVCSTAQAYVDAGRGNDVLPERYSKGIFGDTTPVNAKRMLSIASPGPDHAGEDDYFSSDFDDERLRKTFGSLGTKSTRFAFLLGQKDEFSPLDDTAKVQLLSRWSRHLKEGGAVVDEITGLIEQGSHSFKEGGRSEDELVDRVRAFLSRV